MVSYNAVERKFLKGLHGMCIRSLPTSIKMLMLLCDKGVIRIELDSMRSSTNCAVRVSLRKIRELLEGTRSMIQIKKEVESG